MYLVNKMEVEMGVKIMVETMVELLVEMVVEIVVDHIGGKSSHTHQEFPAMLSPLRNCAVCDTLCVHSVCNINHLFCITTCGAVSFVQCSVISPYSAP